LPYWVNWAGKPPIVSTKPLALRACSGGKQLAKSSFARANRVFGEKNNGLIVDYIGIFRDLQKALAVYGMGPGGDATDGELPIQAKQALIEELRSSIAETKPFLSDHSLTLDEFTCP